MRRHSAIWMGLALALLGACTGPSRRSDRLDDEQVLRSRLLAGEREALEQAISRLAHPDPARAAAAEETLVEVGSEYGPYLRAAARRNDATTPRILRVLGRIGGLHNLSHLRRLAREPAFARAAEEALAIAEPSAFAAAGHDLRRLREYERSFSDGAHIAEVRERILWLGELEEFIRRFHPGDDGRLRSAVHHLADPSPAWQAERRKLAFEHLRMARDALDRGRLGDAEELKGWALRLDADLRRSVPAFELELSRRAAGLGDYDLALDALDRAVVGDPQLVREARSLRKAIFRARGMEGAVYEVRVVRLEIAKRKRRGRRARRIPDNVRVVLRVAGQEVSTGSAPGDEVARWSHAPTVRIRVDESIGIAVLDERRGRTYAQFGPSPLPLSGMSGEADLEFGRVRRLVLKYQRVR